MLKSCVALCIKLLRAGVCLWQVLFNQAGQRIFKASGTRVFHGLLKHVKVCPQTQDLPRFAFDYENLSHPRLIELRHQYALNQFVEAGQSDYQRAWALANWMRCQFEYGDPDRPISRRFDAHEILSRGQAGERFRCGTISGAFIQCLLALGIQARLLNIESPFGQAHVVTEVWCCELGQWVVFDVDNNVAYDIDQKPATAFDLHQLWITKSWDRAVLIKGPQVDFKPADINTFNKVDFYWHFSIKMRNDWFSKDYPFWHAKGNAVLGDLEWQDADTPPRFDRAWVTSRIQDLYWSIDQVRITASRSKTDQVCVQFHCQMPNVVHYEVETNLEKQTLDRPHYVWDVCAGQNFLRVRAVDHLGRKGRETVIEAEMA